MTTNGTGETAPMASSAEPQMSNWRRLLPWMLGFVVLLALPWVVFNDYHRFLLDLISSTSSLPLASTSSRVSPVR